MARNVFLTRHTARTRPQADDNSAFPGADSQFAVETDQSRRRHRMRSLMSSFAQAAMPVNVGTLDQ
jgi:hypothetical protein